MSRNCRIIIPMYASMSGGGLLRSASRANGIARSCTHARLGYVVTADGRAWIHVPAAAAAAIPSTMSMLHIRQASTLDTRTGAEERGEEKGKASSDSSKRSKSDEGLDRSAVPEQQQGKGVDATAATDATVAQRRPATRTASSRLAQLRKNTGGRAELTLEHFLLRDKGVKLWRDFLRATRNIANPAARRETIDWLRDEHFEGPSGLRYLTDTSRIRDALMNGNVTLKRICGPMELASALNPVPGAFPKLVGRRGVS